MSQVVVPRAEWVERPGPEWDFGVHWRLADDGPDWPLYRVSWVVETGELYAIAPARDVIVLGVIPRVGDYPYGRGSAAWTEFNRAQTVEHVMAGWAGDGPRSLDWIRQRLTRAS